jgi:hypothetical protein
MAWCLVKHRDNSFSIYRKYHDYAKVLRCFLLTMTPNINSHRSTIAMQKAVHSLQSWHTIYGHLHTKRFVHATHNTWKGWKNSIESWIRSQEPHFAYGFLFDLIDKWFQSKTCNNNESGWWCELQKL